MDKVRLGIIGLGNMGSGHIQHLKAGQVPRCELAAVCDIDAAKLKKYPDIKGFTDSAKMIRSGLVDAVLIATPHYFHTTIGIDALNNGLHVLTEKPISVHKADAMRLIAAHEAHPELVFAAMFNQRTDPHYIKIKQLIEQGELGKIQRTNWIITTWFRSEAYYRSGGWRATWGGEGGGVLLNQCPHNLDLFQWLCGMPSAVTAIGGIGKYHDIEVEDDITAMFEYPNGATGVFVTTTGEAPGTNRLELTFDRGKIICEHDKLLLYKLSESEREFCKNCPDGFRKPEMTFVEVETDGKNEQHTGVLKAFADRILHGGKLVAEGTEGINGLTLSNAMHLSSWLDRTVEIPFDEDLFLDELNKRRASSRKKTDKGIVFDTTGTY